MKRSKTVQLLLISASPFYLTACNQENYTTKTVQETKNYTDLQSCLDDKQPALVCTKAFKMAKNLENSNPIGYKTKEDCEQDFDSDLCTTSSYSSTTSTSSSSGYHYQARSSGFRLTSTKEVVVDEQGKIIDPATNRFAEKVAQKDVSYSTEPLYQPREGRTPTGLSSSSEASVLHANSGGIHPAATVAGAAAATYMAHKIASSQNTGFSFNQSANKPSIRRYSSGGAYQSSHYSSSRGGFSSHSSSRGFFGG